METSKKKYNTKSALAETEFVETLNELGTVAEQTEALEDATEMIKAREIQGRGGTTPVQPEGKPELSSGVAALKAARKAFEANKKTELGNV